MVLPYESHDAPAHTRHPPVGHHRQTRATGRSTGRRGRILIAEAPVGHQSSHTATGTQSKYVRSPPLGLGSLFVPPNRLPKLAVIPEAQNPPQVPRGCPWRIRKLSHNRIGSPLQSRLRDAIFALRHGLEGLAPRPTAIPLVFSKDTADAASATPAAEITIVARHRRALANAGPAGSLRLANRSSASARTRLGGQQTAVRRPAETRATGLRACRRY